VNIEDLAKKLKESPVEVINYSFRIYEDLYVRFNNHIHLLKHLESYNVSKQKWIIDAIKEKMEFESQAIPEVLKKDRHISFRVEKKLAKNIDKSLKNLECFDEVFQKSNGLLKPSTRNWKKKKKNVRNCSRK
jgi:hypothetical protein